MTSYFTESVLKPLHNTPTVLLEQSVLNSGAKVYLKMEFYNEGGSIKSRSAVNSLLWLEKRGIITPNVGQELVVASGSNFGRALLIYAIRKGYTVSCAIPDNYSPSRIQTLRLMGANVILGDSKLGPSCHIISALDHCEKNPKAKYVDQFSNPGNSEAHFFYTGNEIISDLGEVNLFCCGVGSGGTITGVARRLKYSHPRTRIVAVQPMGVSVLDGIIISHKFQGIGVFSNPPILDKSLIDDAFNVEFDACMLLGLSLMKQQGLFLGLSSLANCFAALELAKRMPSSQKVVTVAPDDGTAYLNDYMLFCDNIKHLKL